MSFIDRSCAPRQGAQIHGPRWPLVSAGRLFLPSPSASFRMHGATKVPRE
ncbi:MAG: hypothetical protein AW07_03741 [Candidatus Accumulibacter sp. SK-11]|nr:MAG: hypothetical protein AW07_03741 [Candidatus Accumulibacter sp. SK-11]